jgi:hypothetical protein
MDKSQRRAAIDDYKNRKVATGIYAVRCRPTGQCWVGQTQDLSKIQNRIWFSLRQNSDRIPALLSAWKEHGADAFTFEVVEELKESESDYLRQSALKERHAHWLAELKASAI